MANGGNRHLPPKKDTKDNKHKNISLSFVIKEVKIKITMKFYYMPARRAKVLIQLARASEGGYIEQTGRGTSYV